MVTGITFMPSAIAACNPSAPAILDLFLSGRNLDDVIRAEWMEHSSPPDKAEEKVKSLSVFHHTLGDLNTRIWGLYWVSLYSRRLHEVLDQLDSKPPGPVTQYYDRWDATQLNSSVALVAHQAKTVGDLLARTGSLPTGLEGELRQHLVHIDRELRGCMP